MTHLRHETGLSFGRLTRALLLFAPAYALAFACDQENHDTRPLWVSPPDASAGEGQGPNGNQGGSAGAQNGTGGTGLTDLNVDAAFPTGDGGAEPADAGCAEIRQEAKVVERPIDIVFIIDNSGSMSDDIAEVKARINTQFAQILDESKVDYRVIMFTKHGRSVSDRSLQVCVKAPLGPDDCAPLGFGGGGGTGNTIDNPPRFFHYDTQVESTDSWCLLFDAWQRNDSRGGPPWSSYLRPGTHKVFVEITDDAVNCTGRFSATIFAEGTNPSAAAMKFDAELRALSEEHFGTKQQRLYTWYSIVGMPINDPANEPWPTDKPLQRLACSGAPAAGLAYQALSMGTGGLRWSICNNKDFSPIFRAIAGGVIKKALPCNWALPTPPAGKAYDSKKLGVQLTVNGTSANLLGVEDGSQCGSGWVLDNPRNPRELSLCPDTCKSVKEAKDAKIEIIVPCESIIELPPE